MKDSSSQQPAMQRQASIYELHNLMCVSISLCCTRLVVVVRQLIEFLWLTNHEKEKTVVTGMPRDSKLSARDKWHCPKGELTVVVRRPTSRHSKKKTMATKLTWNALPLSSALRDSLIVKSPTVALWPRSLAGWLWGGEVAVLKQPAWFTIKAIKIID